MNFTAAEKTAFQTVWNAASARRAAGVKSTDIHPADVMIDPVIEAEATIAVPVHGGDEVDMTQSEVDHIASMVLAVQNCRRGGRQREAVQINTELNNWAKARDLELTWKDMVRVMYFQVSGR